MSGKRRPLPQRRSPDCTQAHKHGPGSRRCPPYRQEPKSSSSGNVFVPPRLPHNERDSLESAEGTASEGLPLIPRIAPWRRWPWQGAIQIVLQRKHTYVRSPWHMKAPRASEERKQVPVAGWGCKTKVGKTPINGLETRRRCFYLNKQRVCIHVLIIKHLLSLNQHLHFISPAAADD